MCRRLLALHLDKPILPFVLSSRLAKPWEETYSVNVARLARRDAQPNRHVVFPTVSQVPRQSRIVSCNVVPVRSWSADWLRMRPMSGGRGHGGREDGTPGAKRWRARPIPCFDYFTFTFACAFFRSAQYFFIRTDTAWRAAADIRRPLRRAVLIVRRTARRFDGSANSGNVRSMAMISARSCFNRTSAPVRANSRKRSTLNPLTCLATYPPGGDD